MKLTLLVSICLLSLSGLCQNNLYRVATIIPPSPTAAALGKYGDIPVSLYNGTPTINIPLYDLKTAGNSLAISMQYDASGVKVSQESSWVGLSWSLNAGGVVSRVIRQKDDFYKTNNGGYYYSEPLRYNASNSSDVEYFKKVLDGSIDTEPDIFSYNFAGYSGKFVMGKQSDGSVIFLDEKNNLRIEYDGGWVFTNDIGHKYYFRSGEIARNYNLSTNSKVNVTGISGLNFDYNSTPITSWYLDSIVSPGAGKIAFQYARGKSLSLVNYGEQVYRLIDLKTICPESSPQVMGSKHTYDISRQELSNLYLDKITFPNGSIEFKKSPRLDIEFLTPLPAGESAPSKLDSIIIKSGNGAVIKKFAFGYSYFTAASVEGRLKLSTLLEIDKAGIIRNPYVFVYNPQDLPSKYSSAVDHWGFYNGSNSNTTLLPATLDPTVSANREPDTSNNYPMSAILQSITFPTGGESVFEYELNDYSAWPNESIYVTTQKYASVNNDKTTQTFTIPPYKDPDNDDNKVPVTIRSGYALYEDGPMTDKYFYGYGTFSDGSNNAVLGFSKPDGTGSNTTTKLLRLSPGTYKIEVRPIYGWRFDIAVEWPEQTVKDKAIGGGVRIKSITNYDNTGKKIKKSYKYIGDDGKSSGKLMSNPRYGFNYLIPEHQISIMAFGDQNVLLACYVEATYNSLATNSIFPAGLSSRSGVIGYSKVTEIQGENGGNGKTEYYFFNQKEQSAGTPYIPAKSNPLNGKLDSVIIYDNTRKIEKTEYTYAKKDSNSVRSLKLFTSPTSTFSSPLPGYYPPFIIDSYENLSYWIVPDIEKNTLWDGANSISTTKKYYYNNDKHRLNTSIDISKSDGKTITTKFKRPQDYVSTPENSFAKQLINRNIISPVIEQQDILKDGVGSRLISGTFTSFALFNNTIYEPDMVYGIETTSPLTDLTESSFATTGIPVLHPGYKPLINYSAYNNYGNILEQQKVNDVKEVYLWGYNSQYPVAKAIGSNYNTVKSFVSQAILDNIATTDIAMRAELNKIRTGLANTSAQVNTYTYSPLLGVTSETDPKGYTIFYEYDNFGRLAHVRDMANNIIKKYEYYYAKQTDKDIIIYSNAYRSASFTRNNCEAGTVGSSVSYNVPVGKHISLVSQADADQKAQNDINTYGQSYANANGSCSVPQISITLKNYFASNPSPYPIYKMEFIQNGVAVQTNSFSGYNDSGKTTTIPAGTYILRLSLFGNYTNRKVVFTASPSPAGSGRWEGYPQIITEPFTFTSGTAYTLSVTGVE